MSTPGWFPDPGGQPDRYRYWDGATWSTETTDDPRHAAPNPTSAPTTSIAAEPSDASESGSTAHQPEPIRPRAARWLVAITVVSMLVAAGSIVLRWRDQPVEQPVPFPTPSAGIQDSSTPPTSGPTGSQTPALRAIGCPEGAPDARSPHPADDRVYGGNLSYPRVTTFVPEAPENRITFAYDVVQQVRTVNLDPPWIAELALGRLLADGYPRTAQHTAELVTECLMASDVYRFYSPVRHDLISRPISVSGVQGWLLTTDVHVQVRGLPVRGDHVAVVVVPDGADWSVFFGAVPIGDQQLTETLERTLQALRVG